MQPRTSRVPIALKLRERTTIMSVLPRKMTAEEVAVFQTLVDRWIEYRKDIPEPQRYNKLRTDLLKVRNAGFGNNPPITSWPKHLLNNDDSIMAAVEHYFLCRWWIGSGTYSPWQLRTMNNIYDFGKWIGVTPRANKDNPTSELTALQVGAKELGIKDGERDLIKSGGKKAPAIAAPPTYW